MDQHQDAITVTLRALGDVLQTIGASLDQIADLLERVDELGIQSPLTLRETAKALRINERTVRRYIADGKLDAFKVGNAWRIPRAALTEIIKKP